MAMTLSALILASFCTQEGSRHPFMVEAEPITDSFLNVFIGLELNINPG
jgi:hypothetical protein